MVFQEPERLESVTFTQPYFDSDQSLTVLKNNGINGLESQLLENIKEGGKAKGIIKNLTDYGAFVDLGGIDGLLHITDMAWKRVKHPSEMVSVGDEIDVVILKYEKDKQRVSLGMKQLGEDPWHQIKSRYPVNTKLAGKITNIADYGCFVEIEEGVEGLVHVSEMDWTNRNVNPSEKDSISVNDEIEVALDAFEDGFGETRLSREKAIKQQ